MRSACQLVAVIVALALLALAIRGEMPLKPIDDPQVVMVVVDPSLQPYAAMWQREVERRFHNAVAILVHGGDFVEGEWIVGTSFMPGRHVTKATELVEHYKSIYPNRRIVLLACNTGHIPLGISGVYYSRSSVWLVPDRDLTPAMMIDGSGSEKLGPIWPRREIDQDAVGNIFEFVAD
jgi:hypothetical protein